MVLSKFFVQGVIHSHGNVRKGALLYTRFQFLYLQTCVLEALTTSAWRYLVHSAAENVSSLAWQTNDSCYDFFKILGDHLIIRFVSGFSDE